MGLEEDPKPRVFVGLRLRQESVDRAKKLAEVRHTTVSQVYRDAFSLGLPALERQEKERAAVRPSQFNQTVYAEPFEEAP